MLAADDVMAFLPNVDCAILVVEVEKNTPEQVAACEYELSSRSKLLGVILNKCRHAVEARGRIRDGGAPAIADVVQQRSDCFQRRVLLR